MDLCIDRSFGVAKQMSLEVFSTQLKKKCPIRFLKRFYGTAITPIPSYYTIKYETQLPDS